MNTFNLIVSTPDGNLFNGKAEALFLRGELGELAIMANHAPFVTAVKPCKCRIVLEDGSEREGSVAGGLLTVSKNSATLISSSFKW